MIKINIQYFGLWSFSKSNERGDLMDGMAIVIAVGFIVCFLAYQMIKNHVLSKVSKAMQNQNYDLVLQLSEKSFYKRFMGSGVCDLLIFYSFYHGVQQICIMFNHNRICFFIVCYILWIICFPDFLQ